MRLPSAVVVTLVFTVAVAYYAYQPLPSAIKEQWKLMFLDAGFRFIIRGADMMQWLGLGHGMLWMRGFIGGSDDLGAFLFTSSVVNGGVRMSDPVFDGIPVRVYEPPIGGEGQLRRAVLFFHGGGWALASAKNGAYDALGRQLADELNAVVVSVEYRLVPEVLFPEPYSDCLTAARYFLSPGVLGRYSVDPERVAVSGDSAGGNLAAAIAQQISIDDSVTVKFSVQALIYPVLQALDFNTPSYQQNQAGPILYRTLMAGFWLGYLGADPALVPLLLANNHSSLHQSAITPEMRARVDWTVLLAPEHRKDYKPVVVATGARALVKEIPGLVDVRTSPLLAEPEVLGKGPRAYVLTCEYDVLRDDGLMYVKRLRDAGVTVTSDHYDDGFHGCLTFDGFPFNFDVGRRGLRGYISWLQENL